MYKIIGSDHKEYGPISAEQIRQWIAEGRLNSQSLLQKVDEGGWRPLSTFPEFSSFAPSQGPTPFAAPPFGAPPPGTQGVKTNVMAMTGMIMGILSVVICCCYGVPFNILGLVFSIIGLNQINKSNGTQKGKGMAIAGLVLSIISIVLYIIAAAFLFSHPEVMEQYQKEWKNI